jgi:acyl-coenzyme A thioesterase PaaI-like protein
MGTDPESSQQILAEKRSSLHPHCIVCGADHPSGLRVDYQVLGEHAVEGAFACERTYEGYANVLHGGIVSALMDGAMANCMLAMGLEAYTVDLRIRFRSPVEIGVPALVRGEWLKREGPLHLLQATLLQNGSARASARAKFMEGNPVRPSHPFPTGSAARDLVKQSHLRIR